MSQTRTLNEYQDRAVKWNKVPAEEFDNRDWFNDFYHQIALGHLLDHKKLSVKEALAELDHLNKDQAHGIFKGLERKEVVHLGEHQIDAIIKHGLTRDEVDGLNKYQIKAFLKLKEKGLTIEQVRGCVWLVNDDYVKALGYLMTIRHFLIQEADTLLSNCTKEQVPAICYGLSPKSCDGLEEHGIKVLIKVKSLEGLKAHEDIVNLNPIQLKIVEDLFYWGATSDKVRNYGWLVSEEQHNVLLYLQKENFLSFDDAIQEIIDLNQIQLEGIKKGLSRKDVLSLNQYQMKALAQSQTAKNGLSAETFKNKDWFNSEDHADAFYHLLQWKNFSVSQAMEELDQLDSHQAKQIRDGETRDNIVGLNQWMLAAIKEHKYHKLTGKDLRGKDWFNSEFHVQALTKLINRHQFEEKMLDVIEKMDANQLKLVAQGYTREQIDSLNPIQIKIILERKYYFLDQDQIQKATWLKSEVQLTALELLFQKFSYQHSFIFPILERASSEKRIPELIETLKQENKSFRFISNINEFEFFKSNNIKQVAIAKKDPSLDDDKLESKIEAFKRIYRALRSAQNNWHIAKTDFLQGKEKLDAKTLMQQILPHLNDKESRTAKAWHLAETHHEKCHSKNVDLVNEIYVFAQLKTTTFGITLFAQLNEPARFTQAEIESGKYKYETKAGFYIADELDKNLYASNRIQLN